MVLAQFCCEMEDVNSDQIFDSYENNSLEFFHFIINLPDHSATILAISS